MWALWVEKVNWENVAGFLAVLGMLGAVLKYVNRLITMIKELPDFMLAHQRLRKEFNEVRRDVNGLKQERSSFRKEVLDGMDKVTESVTIVAQDLSDLKDILLQK